MAGMSLRPSTRLQLATAVALQGLALLLFGLHAYVYWRLPPSPPNTVPDALSVETAWWGLWPVHYLSPWQVVLGGAALVTTIAATWVWGRRADTVGSSPEHEAGGSQPQSPRAAWQSAVLPVLALLLLAAFYLFPTAHTRWGDAFMLANGIAYPDPALRLTHSWQAPLDVFVHSQVWLALHEPLGWEDAVPVYRLLSPLAGLLYLAAALALSRDLERRRAAPAWLTFGLLATLGLLQLFFGYIENYAFAAAGVLAYLWLGLRVAAGTGPLWLAAVVLAVTNATHPSTIVLAPSLLLLGWGCWRGGNKSLLANVLQIALPMALIGGATFVWMEASGHGLYALMNTDRPGGADASWFVPLWETNSRWERYTLLSWPHVRDWINLQLLVAPVVLPSLVIVWVSLWLARRSAAAGSHPPLAESKERLPHAHAGDGSGWGDKDEARSGGVGFLALAAGCYLLFTFVWNPDYGGQRDWDLFSLAALPTTLLLIMLLPRALPDQRFLRAGALPLLLLQGWHTWAWIVQNTLPWQWPD
jgi:hypothetical protein